jgi:hypothetical protein
MDPASGNGVAGLMIANGRHREPEDLKLSGRRHA